MFFSNTHWPQLTAPFYSILYKTSICRIKNSKFSPLMPDEVREHLTRDQRPFLHPESLQILQIHSSMTVLLLFSSPHSFSTGFRSEDWDGHSRSLVLCSGTYFCVVFEVCVWIIARFEDPNMALWRVGRGREPWERSEAGGVIGNERHLHHSQVSSPTEELRKG